jgi:putative spermidine/putrescine transport system substrate-binding protein
MEEGTVKPSHRLVGLFAALALTATACGIGSDGASSTERAELPSVTDWDAVVEQAKGQTVRWYLWGGSESINRFVDETYAPVLEDRYDITLERVPVADTVDAVNQVLAEAEAGTDPGVVDLIWINGENFASLQEAGLLLEDWAEELPNARFVDWTDPSLALDFGVDVDGDESPWSSAQFQFVYDTERTDESDLPHSYDELKDWACANPGRFTYIAPGPGGFQGTRFVKGALFELSGGAEQWAEFDEGQWERWSPELWRYLEELESCLWRDGTTYPKDENELHKLFANDEVDLTITQAIVGPGALIDEGLVPETSRAFTFDDNSIGDFNYVAIPANAPNPAAALVLANLILDPSMQALQLDPANGFGLGFGIDISKVDDDAQRKLLDDAADGRGEAAAPVEELAASRVSDGAAEYQDLVEEGWRREVVGGT